MPRRYVNQLANGEAVDEVFLVADKQLRATASSGRIDTAVVDAYSSDAGRRQILLDTLLPRLGRNNPEVGRTLIDRYFNNAEARAEAEQRLVDGATDQFLAGGSGVVQYD